MVWNQNTHLQSETLICSNKIFFCLWVMWFQFSVREILVIFKKRIPLYVHAQLEHDLARKFSIPRNFSIYPFTRSKNDLIRFSLFADFPIESNLENLHCDTSCKALPELKKQRFSIHALLTLKNTVEFRTIIADNRTFRLQITAENFEGVSEYKINRTNCCEIEFF